MNLKLNNAPGKIKRRKFFLYSGASLLSVYALKDIPMNFFHKKFGKKISSSGIKVTENKLAVKRESRRGLNG